MIQGRISAKQRRILAIAYGGAVEVVFNRAWNYSAERLANQLEFIVRFDFRVEGDWYRFRVFATEAGREVHRRGGRYAGRRA